MKHIKSLLFEFFFIFAFTSTVFANVKIDPRDIKPNTIDETEFGSLNGVKTNIQYQLDQVPGLVSNWSAHPAVSNVDIGGKAVSNVRDIIGSGSGIITGFSDVFVGNLSVTNIVVGTGSVTQAEIDRWNLASVDANFSTNWIIVNSNAVAYALSRSNAWDQAVLDSSDWTNWWALNQVNWITVTNGTSSWVQAVLDSSDWTNWWALNQVSWITVTNGTSSWVQASVDASLAAGWLSAYTNTLTNVINSTNKYVITNDTRLLDFSGVVRGGTAVGLTDLVNLGLLNSVLASSVTNNVLVSNAVPSLTLIDTNSQNLSVLGRNTEVLTLTHQHSYEFVPGGWVNTFTNGLAAWYSFEGGLSWTNNKVVTNNWPLGLVSTRPGEGPTNKIAGTNSNGRVEYCADLTNNVDVVTVTNYFVMPDYTSNIFNNVSNFTIACWLAPDAYSYKDSPFSWVNPGAVKGGKIEFIDTFKWQVNMMVGSTWVSCPVAHAIPVSQWTHLVVVFNRSANLLSVYTNGLLSGTNDLSSISGLPSQTNTIMIGSSWQAIPQYMYDGRIDGLKVYIGDNPNNAAMTSNWVWEVAQYTHPTNNMEVRGGEWTQTNTYTIDVFASESDPSLTGQGSQTFGDKDAHTRVDGYDIALVLGNTTNAYVDHNGILHFYKLTNVTEMTIGGLYRTNWPLDGTFASNWIVTYSDAIAYTLSRSNAWDQAVLDSNFSTNWIIVNSNAVAYTLSRSNAWDQAVLDSSDWTNWWALNQVNWVTVTNGTSSWVQAYQSIDTNTLYIHAGDDLAAIMVANARTGLTVKVGTGFYDMGNTAATIYADMSIIGAGSSATLIKGSGGVAGFRLNQATNVVISGIKFVSNGSAITFNPPPSTSGLYYTNSITVYDVWASNTFTLGYLGSNLLNYCRVYDSVFLAAPFLNVVNTYATTNWVSLDNCSITGVTYSGNWYIPNIGVAGGSWTNRFIDTNRPSSFASVILGGVARTNWPSDGEGGDGWGGGTVTTNIVVSNTTPALRVFDSDSGVGNVFDMSGVTLTETNMPSPVDGGARLFAWKNTNNYGYAFDGTNSIVVTDVDSILNFGGKEFSISFWAKGGNTNSTVGQIPITKFINVAGQIPRWQIASYRTGIVELGVLTDNANYRFYKTGPVLKEDGWSHVVMVFTPVPACSIWTNGVPAVITTVSGGTLAGFDNLAPLSFGGSANTNNLFFGALDEVAIWRRSLSGLEATNLYNAGTGAYSSAANSLFSNCVTAWHLDETGHICYASIGDGYGTRIGTTLVPGPVTNDEVNLYAMNSKGWYRKLDSVERGRMTVEEGNVYTGERKIMHVWKMEEILRAQSVLFQRLCIVAKLTNDSDVAQALLSLEKSNNYVEYTDGPKISYPSQKPVVIKVVETSP